MAAHAKQHPASLVATRDDQDGDDDGRDEEGQAEVADDEETNDGTADRRKEGRARGADALPPAARTGRAQGRLCVVALCYFPKNTPTTGPTKICGPLAKVYVGEGSVTS